MFVAVLLNPTLEPQGRLDCLCTMCSAALLKPSGLLTVQVNGEYSWACAGPGRQYLSMSVGGPLCALCA